MITSTWLVASETSPVNQAVGAYSENIPDIISTANRWTP